MPAIASITEARRYLAALSFARFDNDPKPGSAEFELQMAIAEEVMVRDRDILQSLATK